MSRGKMFITYLFLSILVILFSIPFGYELRAFLYPEEAGLEVAMEEDVPFTPTPVPTPTFLEWQQPNKVITTFQNTGAFRAVVTPKPTPTRPPIPSPTPTPVEAAKGYSVSLCTGSRAILISYTLEQRIVKVGDIVKEVIGGDFKVLEIDGKSQTVKVQLVSDPSVVSEIVAKVEGAQPPK